MTLTFLCYIFTIFFSAVTTTPAMVLRDLKEAARDLKEAARDRKEVARDLREVTAAMIT